ncbi:MAG: Glu/Leu/Phe/Val dehydrogenase [Armatimonadetes bacterium]|nr:Glu/Leu/Phe/Val dehydrogenase [Armatimonadota bacterium]
MSDFPQCESPLESLVSSQEPMTRSRVFMRRAGTHLGLNDKTIAELVSPQEVRVLRIPCKILGKVIVLWGVLALHNNARGPFKGGIRLASDVSLWETVELSRLMTLKTAVTDIEFGGGKTGIRVDMGEMYRIFGRTPLDREFEKIISLDAVEYYSQAMRDVFSSHYYVPAPDMGTGPDEMAFIYNETLDPASVTGKPEGTPGWQPGRRESTGYGVSFVTVSYIQGWMGKPLPETTVAIQGFGNVGSYAALYLAEQGARIEAVTDFYGGTCRKGGLDIEALSKHVARTGTVRGFSGGDSLTNEQLFALDVDILIPAAAGHAVTKENAPSIRAKAVVEAANMPTTLEGMDILTERGIRVLPDILVNAGGVIASMEEYSRSLSAAKTPQDRMFSTIRDLLGSALHLTVQRSKDLNITLSEAAVSLAVERVYDAMKRRRMI